MTITREWHPYSAKRQSGGHNDPCAAFGCNQRIWNFHQNDAGSGEITKKEAKRRKYVSLCLPLF